MNDLSQYVTLGVDHEVFAIPVSKVQEILDMRQIARLPHAPGYLLGLIDVRGHSVPVIDLRRKLGLPAIEPTANSRILVLEVTIEARPLRLGLLADRVFEVTGLDEDKVDPSPEIGQQWRSDCILGIGRRRGALVIIFDIASLIANDVPALVMPEASLAA